MLSCKSNHRFTQAMCYNIPVNLKDFISYFLYKKMHLPLLVQSMGVYSPSKFFTVILVLKKKKILCSMSSHFLVCKLMLLQEFQ